MSDWKYSNNFGVLELIYMVVGSKMRVVRLSAGITQSALAIDLSVSQSTVSDWEHDKVSPTLAQLSQFCNYFKIELFELLQNVQKTSSELHLHDINDEQHVVSEIRKLSASIHELNDKLKSIETGLFKGK